VLTTVQNETILTQPEAEQVRTETETTVVKEKLSMDSIEFGKKCRPYNIQYRDFFGYVPCREDYSCGQEEFFEALLKSIETKKDINMFLIKKTYDISKLNKRYR